MDFCELSEYQKITFEKPFWIHSVEYHLQKLSPKVKEFFDKLSDEKELIKYMKIMDYYDVPSLEELLYFKYYSLFGIKKEDDSEIDEEREKFLFDKYKYYIKEQLNKLSDEEIEDLCNKYYN